MSKSLRDVLAEKKNAEREPDLEVRKQDWLERLSDLYSQIETWLQDLQRDNYLTLAYRRIEIIEELLGRYNARKMIIEFYNKRRIELIPKGLHIIGANGRVDMVFDSLDRDIKIIGRPKSNEWDLAIGFGADLTTTEGLSPQEIHDKEYSQGWKLDASPERYRITKLTRPVFESLVSDFVRTF